MFVEFSQKKGDPILFEVTETGIGEREENVSLVDGIVKSKKSIEEVIDALQPLMQGIVERFNSLELKPDEINLEFSLKISASGKLMVVEATAESLFKIGLKWKK
jgi:hypothetical protein